jgi:protein gp37
VLCAVSSGLIEYVTDTWNPVTGCTPASPGCDNCYAERMSKRLAGRFGYPADDPFRPTFHEDRLSQPGKWKKPRRIFVCSMGDLFHVGICDYDRFKIFDAAKRYGETHGHKFLFLTKRPLGALGSFDEWMLQHDIDKLPDCFWVGVTAENQHYFDERVPVLRDIPAKIRFVSIEPMLGRIELGWHRSWLDWVIVGCESGPDRRIPNTDWLSVLIYLELGIAMKPALFVKQWVDGDNRINRKIHESWQRYPE